MFLKSPYPVNSTVTLYTLHIDLSDFHVEVILGTLTMVTFFILTTINSFHIFVTNCLSGNLYRQFSLTHFCKFCSEVGICSIYATAYVADCCRGVQCTRVLQHSNQCTFFDVDSRSLRRISLHNVWLYPLTNLTKIKKQYELDPKLLRTNYILTLISLALHNY